MKSINRLPKSIALILLCAFVIISCDKDDSSSNQQDQGPGPTAFAENFGNEIFRTFLGNIVDTNNNPLENVMITIGSQTAMTDSNGVFIIEDAPVNQRFGYVKAEKAGFIHASRAVVPSDGTNSIRIMMLPETISGSTTSGTQETISLANGSKVALEGDYIKPDGTEYSGSVNVIIHHLDPADENMQDQMPGMLYAANSQNQERMLQTFGMLAVELRGSGGEDLNLAEGSTAEITVPLDASLIGNAPSTIPLWYFDEANGYWIEEGQATLVGNNYVGTVSHFSFWNCDIPAEAVNLCITVMNSTNDDLANLRVDITSATYGTRNGYTNQNGQVCGLVPSNESLEINIYNADLCGQNSVYSDIIGPFNADSNISITIADNQDLISETVIGQFETCDGNPVTSGYVRLRYGYQYYTNTVTDGNFEINLIRCQDDNTFNIKGSDFVNLQTTDSISYTFTTPITNIGTITACNTVTEFVQYSVDNGDEDLLIISGLQSYLEPNDPNYNNSPTLTISGNDVNCFYMLGVLNEAPYLGEYDYYNWNNGIITDDVGFNLAECISMSGTNNNVIYNLTTLGEVGEYIDINFSGSYEDWNGNPHTINGIIHVLRDQ